VERCGLIWMMCLWHIHILFKFLTVTLDGYTLFIKLIVNGNIVLFSMDSLATATKCEAVWLLHHISGTSYRSLRCKESNSSIYFTIVEGSNAYYSWESLESCSTLLSDGNH